MIGWFHQDIDISVAAAIKEKPGRTLKFPIREEDIRNCEIVFDSSESLLIDCVRHRPFVGTIVEAGVYRGRSLRLISATAGEDDPVVGFDSFEGLPTSWRLSDSESFNTGHFKVREVPVFPGNVKIVKGLFSHTVAAWASSQDSFISLAHIDCDLYLSTLEFLNGISDRIADGTIIVFDELCDLSGSGRYPNWRSHEWKALNEWGSARGKSCRVLCRTKRWTAAVQLLGA